MNFRKSFKPFTFCTAQCYVRMGDLNLTGSKIDSFRSARVTLKHDETDGTGCYYQADGTDGTGQTGQGSHPRVPSANGLYLSRLSRHVLGTPIGDPFQGHRSAICFRSAILIPNPNHNPIPNPFRSEPINFSFNSLLSFRSPI